MLCPPPIHGPHRSWRFGGEFFLRAWILDWESEMGVGREAASWESVVCVVNAVSVVNVVHKWCQCPKCCDVRNAKLAYLFFRVPLQMCIPECPCF